MSTVAARAVFVLVLLTSSSALLLYFQSGFSPLYIASQRGHDSTVKLLVELGADVNQVSPVRALTSPCVTLMCQGRVVKASWLTSH